MPDLELLRGSGWNCWFCGDFELTPLKAGRGQGHDILHRQGAFGIFTERDYVHNVLPCCLAEDEAPADVPLGRPVASGKEVRRCFEAPQGGGGARLILPG